MEKQSLPVVIMWIDQQETVEMNLVASMLKERISELLPYARVSITDTDTCEILSQQLQMGALSIWLQKVHPKKEMLLQPQTFSRNIILHFMMGNDVIALIKDNRAVVLNGGSMDMFNLASYPNKAPLREGQDFISLHINIEPGRVKEAVRLFPELGLLKAPEIMHADGPVRNEEEDPLLIGAVCRQLMRNILTCRYIGDHAYFFLQRAAVDLLTVYCKLMAGPAHGLSENNLQKVKECFGFLESYYVGRHSVTQLSAMFGIHAKVLHEGFSALYGCTISRFQQMLCMRLAYRSLVETPTSMGRIAWLAGFKDIDTFRHAFRAYYKCDPIDLARAQ